MSEPAKTGKRNGLRELFAAHAVALLDHDPGIGGRFSVLTNVGLLPAAVLGLDIGAVREGAGRALAPVLADQPPADVPAAVGAAFGRVRAKGKHISVMMAYADRLERFTRWYVQLWAESLGKDGKGTTPVAALGPVDQHSQLQLFIGGPRDKLFTVITRRDTAGAGPRIPRILAKLAGEAASPAKPSAISSRRKAAPPPRRSPRMAARCAASRWRRWMSGISANCSCTSCWRRSSPRAFSASTPSTSRRSKKAKCWRRKI